MPQRLYPRDGSGMFENFFESFLLIDGSGLLIIIVIVALLLAAIACTLTVRARYTQLERDLRRNSEAGSVFRSPVLNRVVGDAMSALRQRTHDVNLQAIIERAIQSELRPLLVAERFSRASTGLLIILGLVGTFYGLTRSIGQLVSLISGDFAGATEVTESLMQGLTEALSGMSVAFTTSLFGITAAIIMTLVGVFANIAEQRTSLMLELETYLDRLASQLSGPATESDGRLVQPVAASADVNMLVAGLAQSVAKFEGSMTRFESALSQFSDRTRDFQEFNLHLKDNVQRLSLCFADLSDAMKAHMTALRLPPGSPSNRSGQ